MFATAASRRATIAAWSATSRRAARPSHFAPDALLPALEIYRSSFQPSEQLQEPYAMVGANVIVADDDETARRLFTSVLQSFSNILRGRRGQLPAPDRRHRVVLDTAREGTGVSDAAPYELLAQLAA